ncbi:MAG: PAS domain-containing protein [Candidatus Omnitrophica bacterium]|nr:PAS domain-containing protein [Candidatus Omnitrophota bacterium]
MNDSQKSKEQLIAELAELRVSEARYREIVQSCNSIILRMDKDGRIIFINEYGERFFGYYKHEILGRNVVGTIVPKTDKAGRDLTTMIEGIGASPGEYSVNENQNMRSNGELVWIVWTNRAIIDDEGKIAEIICIGNDITKLKTST